MARLESESPAAGVSATRPAPPPTLCWQAASGFQAARRIEALPPSHRAHRLHGHSFSVRARCALPAGWAPFAGAEADTLRARLHALCDPLDYALLNERLGDADDPHDLALARWLARRLDAPGPAQFALRSAPGQGLALDADGCAQAWRRYDFQAAHRLARVPPGHPCARLHGHGFGVVLHTGLDAQAAGAEHAYAALERAWAGVRPELDHACLNDLPGLDNPTSEMLAGWLWARLQPALPLLAGVTVHETASCGARFDGARYRIWKDLHFDSALRLRRAPEDSVLNRRHGHSYLLRLHLSAPLDTIYGWLADFGDVKRRFEPLYRQLDHRDLNDLSDLPDADCASLAAWIWRAAHAQLPWLAQVELQETPDAGVLLRARG